MALKLLAQLRPNNTTANTVYTVPDFKSTSNITCYISNTQNASIRVRLFVDNNGATYGKSTSIIYNTTITARQTLIVDIPMIDLSGGTIGFRTNTANQATITVYGTELTA